MDPRKNGGSATATPARPPEAKINGLITSQKDFPIGALYAKRLRDGPVSHPGTLLGVLKKKKTIPNNRALALRGCAPSSSTNRT